MQEKEPVKVLIIMDKHRLKRIADRKIQQENIVHVCRGCGQSSGFRWNFDTVEPTKTCFECGFSEPVDVAEKQGEAA